MRNKGALATVFLAILIDLMGFGIVLPLLPFYASAFNAPPVAIGLLYSVYSLCQLIFSPIWGGISDRIGRRPIMLMSTLGASFAYLLFGLAHSLPLLFLSRLIAGIMGGNISTAQAYVADVTTAEDRARGMGLVGAAFGIGFVMGPAIGTLLIHPAFLNLFRITIDNEFALPGFFAALLSLGSFVFIFFKLPESVEKGHVVHHSFLKRSIFSKGFWSFISGTSHTFPWLVGCMFLLSFAQASLYSSFPLFCKYQLSLSAERVGMLFVYMGVIAILIQGGLTKTLAKRYGEQKLFYVGSIAMALGLVSIPFALRESVLLVALTVMTVGASLMGPALNSLISKEADPHQVGATMGASQGMASLGRVLGPTWGGFLYDMQFKIPFLLTAFCFSFAISVAARLNRKVALKP